jgi:hypothetical protein
MIAIERLHAIGFVPVANTPDRHRLSVGERFKILPGTAHRISNESTSECQFLLVQGVVDTTGVGLIWLTTKSHDRISRLLKNAHLLFAM